MTIARSLALLLLPLGACAAHRRELPSPTAAAEEIWFVARSEEALRRTGGPAAATPLVLERSDVQATVLGPLAAVRIRQAWAGPERATDGALVVPLPPDATFHDLVVTLGRRHIRAIVRARAEAETLYAAAIRSGHVASLLHEQDGAVVAMARLAPHTPIGVEVSYAATIPWHAGAYELVLPRLSDGAVGATIEIDGLAPLTVVASPTHAIVQTQLGPDRVRVVLSEPATPRGELVLRYGVDADVSPGGVVVSSGRRATVAAVVLHPVAAHRRPVARGAPAIDWGRLEVADAMPPSGAVSPERALVVLARVRRGSPDAVRVTGRDEDAPLPVIAASGDAADVLPALWAAAALRALSPDGEAMRAFALRYGVLSPLTALVAVDASAPRE